MSFDYTTVGHVTIDVLADGTRQAGGSAFYSALQAARLGRRALVHTRGAPGEIEQLLAPYGEELSLQVEAAPCTTTLSTTGIGHERAQRMVAWAGAMELQVELDTTILHLAPVARETGADWRGRAALVGVTPQGLLRTWTRSDSRIVLAPLQRSQLPERCEAAVFSKLERPYCEALLDGSMVVAVTDEADPTELLPADGRVHRVEVPAIERMRDDMGAGDVFAAAFFIALADGEDPLRAAAFANAAAAVRIAGTGPAAVGDRAAIEARLATLG
ncbi:MAG TPA: PfkB family carbohydrate kinase [Solirubrobacteraceae bacterium]|nr:PfkB family carbohydrate kinase [Solirubrobacteraceae bacterium]